MHSEFRVQAISEFGGGSQVAFNQFVKKYQLSMKYTARAIVGVELADDVVQDAWLSIFRNIKKFEGRASLRTWMLVITANMAKAYLRKSLLEASRMSRKGIRFASTEEYERLADCVHWHDETPDAILALDRTVRNIEDGLRTLPRRQREVMVLCDYQGVAMSDAAAKLGITQGNVRVLLHRARTTLISRLGE